MHNEKLKRTVQKYTLRIDPERIISFGYKSANPQRQLVVGYLGYSILGTLALMLPFATKGDISFIDNLFNAVSALSTTGLATADLAKDYTFFGQLVILLLIQIGGLGYMTLSSFIMLRITHHLGNFKNNMFGAQFSFPQDMPNEAMIKNIVRFVFFFEIGGTVLLYPYFAWKGMDQPLWSALFHSVSALCTAGFSIYSDNLVSLQCDYYANIIIIVLSYMGAMGFIMMTDILHKFTRKNHRISFTTKVIICITCLLSLWCTIHLFFFEPSLQHYDVGDRILISLFQSMSAMTTVGYNTVDLSNMIPISLLILSLAMYIGASPSGTGGGLKSTTLSAIYAYTKNKLGLRKDVSLMNHIIPDYRVESAITTFIFYTFILFFGIYLMALFEPSDTDFLKIIFEASSALATAGLTCGILSSATLGSKIILIILMFIGRIGVITLGNVLLIRSVKRNRLKKDDLIV